MQNNTRVNERATKKARVPVGARYPLERRKLLEVLQIRRGDEHLSDTIAAALDDMLERHGLLERDKAA